MPEDNKTIQPINASVDEVAKAMICPSKEIRLLSSQISILSQKSTAKEISPVQGSLDLEIEMDAEFGEIGMDLRRWQQALPSSKPIRA